MEEVLAAGRMKLASMPAGGGCAPAASGGGASTAAAPAEEKKEEKKEGREKEIEKHLEAIKAQKQ